MAKKQYGSILFPFEETTDGTQSILKRTENINDTLISALKAFFLTRRGQRRGNIIGSVLGDYKHTLIKKEALYAVEDEVKQELNTYFRGVSFIVVEISQKTDNETNVPTLTVSIQFALPGKELQTLVVLI